jgi:hypothetical protein
MSDVESSPPAQDLVSAGAALVHPPTAGLLAAESAPEPAAQVAPEPVKALTAVVIAPEPLAPPPLTAVQLALYAGWTMAVLYGTIQDPPADRLAELPASRELQPADRRELELCRLRHLLQYLSFLPGLAASSLENEVPASAADAQPLTGTLENLNLRVLGALAAAPPEMQLAYELGRSLRDTANPPLEYATGPEPPVPALSAQLARDRVAKLQEWLATLSPHFPDHAARVVATSLGRWSEFVAATVSMPKNRRKQGGPPAFATTICEYLLPQGDSWLMLLTGARPASGLLSPEGYVAAGELALRRSAAIARRILRHYWAAMVIVAAALGGILYLAASNLSGAAKVWTSIGAIGGYLGISANAIRSRTSGLAAEAGKPVFAMAEEDAMAWAITTLPAANLSYRGVQQLRKAGIAPSSSLGRF